MNQSCFQASDWYQAITLTERIASLRAVHDKRFKIEIDTNLTQRRAARWQSQSPFSTHSYFAQRLEMDGTSENELRYLLGEPVEAIHNRFPIPPTWLMKLSRAFARPAIPDTSTLPVPEASDNQAKPKGHGKFSKQEAAAFLNVIKPLIREARDHVRAGAQALSKDYDGLLFDPTTIERTLFANLPGQLISMLSRALVLELNVARLQGLLCGTTPEERFQSFFEHLRQPDAALALFQEYPVLARQLTICLDHWADVSLEFLKHLCADWEMIRAIFSPACDPGRLVEVNSGVGDKHRGGRSVLIAKFSSGFQIVYKPKSLAVDVHFQELLTWLNGRGDHPPFRTLKILDRGTYGWAEFVNTASCDSSEEVRRFYERQGGYLALLYALEATDFHYENLIAAGEHPMLIDLEALFHQRVGGISVHQADVVADNTIAYSALRVGLLPQRIWSNAEGQGIDLSGLGATAGQLSPDGVPFWEDAGTDAMRCARKRMAMPGSHNRPTINGDEVNVLNYAEAILTGFTAIYQLLLEHRHELLADDGPLARFTEDEVRVILRPTRTYGMLLHESFHPDVLRDALDRDRLFDRLWVVIEHLPHLAKVIPAERDDLQQGDIPMFTTRPGSRSLLNSAGEEIADFFDEPGITLVRRRVQQLSEENHAQQLWFIRASLTTLAMEAEQTERPTRRVTETQATADREQLLRAACAVGDRLGWLALRGEEQDVSWIGLQFGTDRHWSLVALGPDLYDGLPGVALFLAYLGAITQEERYTALAQSALTMLRRQIERSQQVITSIGGFDGWGGVIYTLAHLYALWNQPALLVEAEAVAHRLPNLIEQDEQLDIIGGAAGCIGGLISLYRCAPSERTLAAAIQCGDRLINRAQSMEHGIGWTTKISETKALTGFSHGAAGIAWALLELVALTGENRFQQTALAAIDYERSLFSPEAKNWPDLRENETDRRPADDAQSKFMTAWCHGAPGIGMARLRSLPYLDDAEVRAEIDTALQTTLARGFGSNHSLCHGDLGNLELLLQADQIFNDPALRWQTRNIAATILESIKHDGWLCGVPLGVEVPGLMTGLAGIGYELLRLAEPTRVPSVLVLQAPPTLRLVNG